MFLSKILKTPLFQSLSVEWPVFFVKYIYIFWLFSAMTFCFFEQCSVMNTTDLKSDSVHSWMQGLFYVSWQPAIVADCNA